MSLVQNDTWIRFLPPAFLPSTSPLQLQCIKTPVHKSCANLPTGPRACGLQTHLGPAHRPM